MTTLWLLWRRFSWRHWLQTPKTTILLVSLIALGVGVFLSIRLANRAAVAGFTLFTDSLTGQSDFALLPVVADLEMQTLVEVREALGVLPVTLFAVVETTATDRSPTAERDDFYAEQFQLIGLDLMALANLAYLDPRARMPRGDKSPGRGMESGTNNWRIDGSDYQVFVSAALARKRQFKPGDSLPVIINDRPVDLEICGVLPETDLEARAPEQLLLMDLPAVQALIGGTGQVSRIEARLFDGPRRSAQRRTAQEKLTQLSAGRWTIETPQTQRETGQAMTRAFRLNLTVLSALALVVGIYLILQALEAAVVRRRSEIAVLISLGVERRLMERAWLVEALVLGIIGTLLGIVLGVAGAQLAVRAVARTVNALYYSHTIGAARLDLTECLFAASLGIVASLMAGWLPARDAARTPPAQVLQRAGRGGGIELLDRPWVGVALLLVGAACYFAPPLKLSHGVRFPLAGYVAASCWALGGSIVASVMFRGARWLLGGAASRSSLLRYAVSQVARPSGRHRLTVAGLVIAIGMAAGMSILIHSFDVTMRSWIGHSLRADLYVAPRGVGNVSSQNRLSPSLWRAIAQDPDVADYDLGQFYPLLYEGTEIALIGVRFGAHSNQRQMVWVEAPQEIKLTPTPASEPFAAWVSESFSERFEHRSGDVIMVSTPSGKKRLKIAAVFADYGNERGSVLVPWDQLAEWFSDESVVNVAAYLRTGSDAEKVRHRWMEKYPGITVRANHVLRADIFKVFRQTFSVTQILKGIGIAVAVAGLGLALVSLLLERKAEMRTLKSLGMERNKVARAVAIEGVIIGAVGLAAGLILSVALGYLLIYVINKQTFGWTLAFQIPKYELISLGFLVLTTSWIVAYSVGRWAASLPVDQEE